MQPSTGKEITELVGALAGGDVRAGERLFPLVYEELRALAAAYFRNQPADHTLQPTALVHEAYVKLIQDSPVDARDRSHFMALAARVMRQVLIDHARSRSREKRGAGWERITLAAVGSAVREPVDVEALEEALQRLAALSERKARLVELRFFGGLSEEQAADVLQISRASAAREWRFARAWLIQVLWPEGEA
ncbi:MAG: ECF-type sigma factor [Phycisphaerae bacterium]